jgi:hypothetical protein
VNTKQWKWRRGQFRDPLMSAVMEEARDVLKRGSRAPVRRRERLERMRAPGIQRLKRSRNSIWTAIPCYCKLPLKRKARRPNAAKRYEWLISIRGSRRDVVCLGWPIAPLYVSPTAGGGYSCAHRAQLNFGDLTPYLIYDFNILAHFWTSTVQN